MKQRYAKRQANGVDIARVYFGLDDRDQVFVWLEKDFQTHNATMPSWFYIVPFDSLRLDPRFKDLVKRMGMPEVK